jgi:GDP-L-fucose synthase
MVADALPSHAGLSLAGLRVWVAGHRGMVGSALVRRLAAERCVLVAADRGALDLRRQADVEAWMATNRPDVVFLAAAKVGGILANAAQPADFLLDNLQIQANVVETAYRTGVRKLLIIGSSSVYPRLAPQPIGESALLTGPLEPTHEGYAVAKIAGLKLAQAFRLQHGCDFICALPTNLYGPGDNFDPRSSHVLPALIRKAHVAKTAGEASVTIWGSGQARREFLHADDCADALVHLMKTYSDLEQVNVGSGEDLTILELTRLVCEVVGFTGEIIPDAAKPDGPPRKLMAADKLRALGWSPSIALGDGVAETYAWFLANLPDGAAS